MYAFNLVHMGKSPQKRNTVARLITDIYERQLHAQVASGLAHLMTLRLRAIETADLELRLTKIERKLEKLAAADKTAEGRQGKQTPQGWTFTTSPRSPEKPFAGDGHAQSAGDPAVGEGERSA